MPPEQRPDYDPQIARLAHPYRVPAAMERTAEENHIALRGDALFALPVGQATYDRLVPLLAEHSLNQPVITKLMREDPAFARFAREQTGQATGTFQGNLWWFLDTVRWRTQGRHYFVTTDVLDQLLAETDIGEGIPASSVRPPYPVQYIAFTESGTSPLVLHHAQSGEHRMEGCYVLTGVVPAGLPEGGMRFIEFVFTGSPEGKAHNTDDATSAITLVIHGEGDTMLEVLEASLAKHPEMAQDTQEIDDIRAAVYHCAKVLLYLNSDKVERDVVRERTELEARIARVKGGKAAKLLRQLGRAYDRIVIGPKSLPQEEQTAAGAGRAKVAHWRRGHFRSQPYGEGRLQRKVIFIAPVLIHGDTLGAASVQSKPYVIKGPDGR